jgi:hypothetical protein
LKGEPRALSNSGPGLSRPRGTFSRDLTGGFPPSTAR